MSPASAWLTLIVSLPGPNTAARVRIWRAFKACGAAALRDGAYLLPGTAQSETVFRELAEEIETAGGTAYIAEYHPLENRPDGDLKRLFDRTAAYSDLLQRLDEFKRELSAGSEVPARRALATIRRELAAVVETDFFPGPSRSQVEQALADAEAALNAHFSPDEPHAAAAALRRCAQADYQGKTWVTRAHLWVDRVASAWLIRRFIDPQARFVWLEDLSRVPAGVIGFDFDGADFTHVGTRVTFEVLVFSFGLENDPAVRWVSREGGPAKAYKKLGEAYGFDPGTIVVTQGETVTVTIRNLEAGPDDLHSFTLPAYRIDRALPPLATVNVTFKADRAGVFSFYCDHHKPWMSGELVVLPAGQE